MTELTDHERCSELLRPYVEGELAADAARDVEAHLHSCAACAAEHRALLALQAPEPAGLSDMERARLRRAVLEEAVPAPAATSEPPEPSERRARLFPLLGAAAIVALIAVFAYIGVDGMSGSDEGASMSEVEGGDAADVAEGGGGDGGARSEAESLEDTAGGTAGGAGSQATAEAPPPEPTFRESIGEVDRARLNRIGRRGLPLVVFSRAYTVADVETLRDDFVEQLAEQAPAARGRQIRECVASITSNFPTALPAYGAIGEFVDRPQREVLIVAFAWTNEPQGPLDQSMVWAWPLGNCDAVAHYSKNVIEPTR